MLGFVICAIILLFSAFFIWIPIQKITEYYSVEGEKRILFLLSLSDEDLEEQLKNASVYDRIYIWYLKEKEKNE